jgi:SAM-dependent MidA family methyltransferase
MLKQIIADRISREGAISFRDFMEMALYYPEYGYYTSADTEIGCRGDFYTSSHVHPVFGALIGKQIAEMWEVMGKPESFHIIEMGAGRGYLAHDMLSYLRETEFYDALSYVIVEINQHIKEKQEEQLSGFNKKTQWVSSLTQVSPVIGCVFSNELLDAFPVHLIHCEGGRINEIYVNIENDEFYEVYKVCKPEVINYLSEFCITLPQDYRTEVNLDIKDWLKDAAITLREGFIFTIDYGYPAADYYSPERTRGTLLCYYRHQVHDNLYQQVGEQDISAHVNFSSVKKWGEEYGFEPIGFSSQGSFLVSLRIDELLQGKYAYEEDLAAGRNAVSKLVSPEGLGESHRVLIQYKGKQKHELSGFCLRNRLNTL